MKTTQRLSGPELIEHLAIPHRRRAAVRSLLGMGFEAAGLALDGLKHEDPEVRASCAEILDHYLVPEALPALIDLLDDPDPHVRQTALHTLACDRCKEGECRPEEEKVLPKAIHILEKDTDPKARVVAIEVIGNYVHTSSLAESALIHAKANDPSPLVRKKATWYAPGGTIYQRTARSKKNSRK